MQLEKTSLDRVENPKVVSYGNTKGWSSEEDAHYMKLVKDERSASSHIDATSKETFWLVVQKKLEDLGYFRTLSALRSRWHYKMYKNVPEAEEFAADQETDMNYTRNGERHRPTQRRSTRGKYYVSDDEEVDDSQFYLGSKRASRTRSLRKRSRMSYAIDSFSNSDEQELVTPAKKPRNVDSPQLKPEPGIVTVSGTNKVLDFGDSLKIL